MLGTMPAPSLARVLLAARVADAATLGQASAISAEGGVPLVFALARWRLVDAGALAAALSRSLQREVTSLLLAPSPPPVALARSVCARLRVLALARRGDVVVLGMSDPTDDDAAGQVAAAFGVNIERVLVDDDELERALRRVYPRADELVPLASSTATVPASTSASLPPGFRSVGAFADVASSASSSSSSPPMQAPAPLPRTVSRPTASPPVATTTIVQEVAGVDESASSFAVSVVESVPGDLPSEVFADAPLASVTAPTGAPHGMLFTDRVVDRPVATRPAGWVSPAVSQDVTIPADVLSVLKLLVVADPVVARGVDARLRPILRELVVVHRLEDAQHLLTGRTFNEVAIVDPPDTVAASQAIATLGARQKRGVLVVSQRMDFARLPGVRIVPCGVSEDVVGVITAALHAAARA